MKSVQFDLTLVLLNFQVRLALERKIVTNFMQIRLFYVVVVLFVCFFVFCFLKKQGFVKMHNRVETCRVVAATYWQFLFLYQARCFQNQNL